MKKLKIVILSGTIYPRNSPRAFRSTELAKGLANKGHKVTLYGLTGAFDYKQFEQETGIKVKGMGTSYLGNPNSDDRFLSDSKLFWFFKGVLKRLFYNIIDCPRVEFFFKAIKVLKLEDEFDYLITVAHPYGLHWGAAYFRKRYGNKKFKVWSSDCGDPFMGDPNKHRKKIFLEPIEKFWCKYTDYITIPVVEGKSGYYEEFRDKIQVIPQGIDFNNVLTLEYRENKVPTFVYSGVTYSGLRDPTKFLEYLCGIDQNFKFIVYTRNDILFSKFQKKLENRLEVRSYIPRLELIKILSTMDFIINIKNNSDVQLPSKLIEYGLAKRPIVEVSTNFTETEKNIFEQFIKGDYRNQKIIHNISQFDINIVCDKFLELYDRKISLQFSH